MTDHTTEPQDQLEGIAIIGMAGRFPGAASVAEFWQNLVEGRDTISRFGPDELEARNRAAREAGEDYVRAHGILEDAAMFDAEYFGIPPREAERMDPQHRLFLEACSNALEDAGYVSASYPGEIGLFAGCSLNTYLLHNLAHDRATLEELTGSYQVGEFATLLGNDKDFLTTRAAYKLNLRGPVVSVQSACATSLVAICQASQALLNYSCDMALAGGVSVTFPQHRGHVFQEGSIVSRDGHCRPFDAEATGTVFGHGVGVVLLKRLEDAVRDRDHITAVIRGFAVNNDGSAKAGYMAPGVDGQSRVIATAQAMAGISADTVSYIEAHGTGTPLGDPVEIGALTEVFRAATDRTGFCQVGTAKGNIGHLDSAAGVTGVIKTALSLAHRTLPGLAHFNHPNPALDLATSPFFFRGDTRPWVSDGHFGGEPLRAGVSAFGVGGVNAHIVMEEAPAQTSAESSGAMQVLCVSGRSPAAAEQAALRLADHFDTHPGLSLADAAYTLAIGRLQHPFRIAIAAADVAEASARLRAAAPASVRSGSPQVAFLFSGQGTQYPGMARVLHHAEPVFRGAVDACLEELEPSLSHELRGLLLGENTPEAAARLERTELAQPAIFIAELALATLWQAWGLAPAALLGHSLGEYVAATLAGVFPRADALRLVTLRARLMGALPAGAMLSVALPADELTPYLHGDLALAAANAPRASVLSGPFEAIADAEQRLAADGIATRRLHTSHAFHSPMMQPMLAEFEAALRDLTLHAPQLPIISSVTGARMTEAEATSPAYWAQQCVQPVLFERALSTLLQSPDCVLLEVGAGETLKSLARRQMPRDARNAAIASLTRDGRTPMDALAELWSLGISPDWDAFFAHEHRSRIPLPTYPFERKLHWIAPPAAASATLADTRAPVPTIESEPMPEVLPATPPHRALALRIAVAAVLAELSGIETTPDEAEHQFLELGFDSLFLTQATQALSKRFGVKLTFRQLVEQFPSIAQLADHLDATLPAEAFAPTPAPVTLPAPTPAPAPASTGAPLERLLADQLAAMSQMFADQVATLRTAAGLAPATNPAASPSTLPSPAPAPGPVSAPPADVRMVRPVHGKATQELTPPQEHYIAALIARYEAKTPGSKQATQAGRAHLADPRAVAGFRREWKEMVYPLLVERARGSRLWDVDGNEYIDIVNGYGCILFGHSPDFVVRAATEQLDRGVAIGPQSPLAAEVAELLCELTGNERVTFCNTGSEAVMAAIRVARTVTGRDKFVYFAGDYHGTFDEVLIRATPRGSAPVAPGIPLANTSNVVVLEYGAQASLDYIRTHGEEIAAVLIEPVQTRNPGLQPADFIRQCRRITEDTGSALILDEVVTGFRLAPGGAQQHFCIRADMCTYGKVIGGGHPIGVLSGKRLYLDALDGGAWQFGDDSGPEVGVTFFAGTFVRHPLALAAARSVLLHLQEQGPALQRDLNAKTARLAESLDSFFVERGVPARIHHFCSWFYFTFAHDARLASLLYYSMRAKGIHIQEGYPCFLTTAHTDADLAAIEQAFRDTIVEMQEAGVLPSAPLQQTSVAANLHPQAIQPEPATAPITEPQREIFLAAALNDDANCAFNESLTLDLRGPLRMRDLAAAIDSATARHDALRTTVAADGESLCIAPAPLFYVQLRDLLGMDDMSQQAAWLAAIEHDAVTPFDLTNGPLIRASLFRLAPDHARLLLTAHHIVLDGWSANVLLDEIGRIYSQGPQAQLGALLPFSSYALHEIARAAAGDFDANETFWVNRFRGRTPRLELPTDRPRGAEKTYRGSTLEGSLGKELYAHLKLASARTGCTLYVTLLAGFQMLLHRLTGQGEVVVGISTAGQALYDNASLVGHCVHFLPMLSEAPEGVTAADLLRSTRSALLDAYDHQEFTYGSLLRKLKLEREPGRLPLIEVQFNLEKVGESAHFDSLSANIKANPKRFVNTDLFLNVVESANGLDYMLDFNTDLFDTSTVARWMRHWAELLQSLANAPERRVDDLAVIPAADLPALLAGNSTSVDFGLYEPITASFLRRAADEPDRIALECAGVTWTCARLADYARTLAAHLLAQGCGAGDLVGIAVERSPEMLGAVLAVMLTGAAYVPLDPRHPAERLNGILADAGARLLLTRGPLQLTGSTPILRLDELPQSQHPDTLHQLPDTPADALAYVIYTSGSTGKPKGVAVEHGALRNLLRSMQREPGLQADDTLVAITTLAFDIAGLELLLPLLTGARLVIATDAEVGDGRLLLALLERSRSPRADTVLQATPGAWRLLLDAGWDQSLPLKALCGGEALPRDLAERMLDRAREVWNMYGPTETTIWSSATRVEHGTGPLRLGAPIANTQFYVLDGRHHLAPLGVTGELFIGGAGLARGYWNRPELTAEKFLPNPLAREAGAGAEAGADAGASPRLYATGDLARRLDDGTIELLGRADFQVKIRGYRIELGEIEAALTQHPEVHEAVVTPQKSDATGITRLIAYLATGYPSDDSHATILAAELPSRLARSLPDYMVPSHFIVLPALPRNSNGKVDRNALPAPAAPAHSARAGEFVAPSTPEETTLARIWAEVLEVPAVSISDTIFELGADSLLIFRMAARAQREGLPVTATLIFQHRTIAGVCASLAQSQVPGPVKVTTRITAASRDSYRMGKVKLDA